MSEAPDRDSKTEEPTPKKIADAIEKGDTPFTRELTVMSTTAAILLACWLVVPKAANDLTMMLRVTFANGNDWPFHAPGEISNLIMFIGRNALLILSPLFILLIISAIAGAVSQNPPRIVLERIRPKASRVSLAQGWKRLVGRQMMREFVKSIFKFLIAGGACALVFLSYENIIIQSILAEANRMPAILLSLTSSLLGAVLAAIVVLAGADLLWTRWDWFEQQRMTRQEVKDEMKQMEVDPHLKQRIRAVARSRTRRRMIADVADATMVIANPTHYAVALKYAMGEDEAPRVVAKGMDRIALKIRETAEENNVPVFEDPPLARSLYAASDIDMEIPPEFYVPVAQLVRLLYDDNRER